MIKIKTGLCKRSFKKVRNLVKDGTKITLKDSTKNGPFSSEDIILPKMSTKIKKSQPIKINQKKEGKQETFVKIKFKNPTTAQSKKESVSSKPIPKGQKTTETMDVEEIHKKISEGQKVSSTELIRVIEALLNS